MTRCGNALKPCQHEWRPNPFDNRFRQCAKCRMMVQVNATTAEVEQSPLLPEIVRFPMLDEHRLAQEKPTSKFHIYRRGGAAICGAFTFYIDDKMREEDTVPAEMICRLCAAKWIEWYGGFPAA